MSGAALSEEQRLTLLQRELKWAEEKTEFYRAAFARAGIRAASVTSFSDLAHLPFWENAAKEGADAPFFMLTGRIHCYTHGDVARQVQTATDLLAAYGVNRANTVLLAGDFTDSRTLDLQYALDTIGAAVLPCTGGTAAQVLRAAVPDTVIAWEHELPVLAEAMGDLCANRLITIGTHLVPQEFAREMAQRMGVRHTHIFTLAQMGALIGGSCSAGEGIHLEERLFFAEVVDGVGQCSRADGARGELVLSALTAEAMPVLRYRTGLSVRFVREGCGDARLRIIEE